MNDQEHDVITMLESAEMKAEPTPVRRQVVRARMLATAETARRRRRPMRVALLGGLVVLSASSLGLGGTEAGRAFLSGIFTPVRPGHEMVVETEQGTKWATQRDGGEGFTEEEAETLESTFSDIDMIREAGGGRLTGILDSLGEDGEIRTTLQVEYFPGFGIYGPIGHSPDSLTEKQRENMRIDETLRLHDAGEGELVRKRPHKHGDGCFYDIRYTFADRGSTVVQAWHPPGPREDRAMMFAEARKLRDERRFTVIDATAFRAHPEIDGDTRMKVFGDLRYELSNGHTVTLFERIPDSLISRDGKHVVVPDSAEDVPITMTP